MSILRRGPTCDVYIYSPTYSSGVFECHLCGQYDIDTLWEHLQWHAAKGDKIDDMTEVEALEAVEEVKELDRWWAERRSSHRCPTCGHDPDA